MPGRPETVPQLLAAAVREAPDRPFLVTETGEITYAEMGRRVERAAAAWQAMGVCKGDRVAFLVENRSEFLEAWLGLATVGGTLVAINIRWTAPEVARFLELCRPRFALVSRTYEEVWAQAAASLDSPIQAVHLDGRGPDEGFGALMATAPDPLPVSLDGEDLISFISTSGTTGAPKAVMQTHRNYVLTGEGYASWMRLRAGERLYLCLPLFHVNSQAYTTMGAIAARATIILVERFSASRFWSDMVRYEVDLFNYVGSMLMALLKREPDPDERRHHVRLCYGGPALPGPLHEEAERRFGMTIISGIGMSETTFGLIESPEGERRPGSLGTARQHPDLPFVNEARVVDNAGNDVPRGAIGELILRNGAMMKGYYRNAAATRETIREGWLHTGDLVRQDEDGFFWFVDRKKDVIRVRGENVSSAEVEEVLTQHPDVNEAAVMGVPSEMTDDQVVAFVVPRAGTDLTEEALRDWCAGRLAPFKIPSHIWFRESLPKTETQRVEKHRLRTEALGMLKHPTSEQLEAGGRVARG